MINEGTWSIPNNIIDLYDLNSLRRKTVEELTKEDRALLYRTCGNDEFFNNLENNSEENVWIFISMYLEDVNNEYWHGEFYLLKYYEGYGWAFKDQHQCFKSLFTDDVIS